MSKKKVSCDCGKVISATTDDELVVSVQQHAREVHSMELSREQVLSMAEPV
jgi:predicted small metal-binding protein